MLNRMQHVFRGTAVQPCGSLVCSQVFVLQFTAKVTLVPEEEKVCVCDCVFMSHPAGVRRLSRPMYSFPDSPFFCFRLYIN